MTGYAIILITTAREALEQIDAKRYGADLKPDKQLIMVGIAFYKKSCKVRVKVHR